MRKVILTFGLISGVLVSTMMLISVSLMDKGIINFDNGEIIGYTTMLIALSMIFFGIKTFRDRHQNGIISFGTAFKIGSMIALISSIMYVLAWEACLQMNPGMADNFMAEYSNHVIDKMQSEGVSQNEIETKRIEMAEMAENYKNPLIRAGFTILEIFPLGLVISLICAAILKRKPGTASA